MLCPWQFPAGTKVSEVYTMFSYMCCSKEAWFLARLLHRHLSTKRKQQFLPTPPKKNRLWMSRETVSIGSWILFLLNFVGGTWYSPRINCQFDRMTDSVWVEFRNRNLAWRKICWLRKHRLFGTLASPVTVKIILEEGNASQIFTFRFVLRL